MKIGLSLPSNYLSGTYNDPVSSIYYSALGPVDSGLQLLRSEIECIELGFFMENTPAEQIVEAVQNVWSAGLEVSVHAYLPEKIEGDGLTSVYTWLKSLLPILENHQEKLVINLHALASVNGNLDRLKEKTVENLKKLADLATTQKLPVYFALELNRSKGEVDPSTTYLGVLDMCLRINSQQAGIGWDWGHAYANVLKHLLPPEPPPSFIRKVIHTHIHDLGPNGGTHWPLTCGTVPLVDYLKLLKKVDYSGLFILELQPKKYAATGSVQELLLSSIRILRKAGL